MFLTSIFTLQPLVGTDDELYRKDDDETLLFKLTSLLNELRNSGVQKRVAWTELAFRHNMTNYNRIAATLNNNMARWAAGKTWVKCHFSVIFGPDHSRDLVLTANSCIIKCNRARILTVYTIQIDF